MSTVNDLLLHTIRSITKENKEQVIAMVKDVIIPMMAQELKKSKKKPNKVIKKEPVQIATHTDSVIPVVKSGNNHKSEKVNDLEEWEKDLIRYEFIKVNGEITRDFCLEIKKKLSKKTSIFQVTGFVSLLHKYVANGDLRLYSLEHYHYFQYLKKYGEEEYKQEQSGNNTRVITIERVANG